MLRHLSPDRSELLEGVSGLIYNHPSNPANTRSTSTPAHPRLPEFRPNLSTLHQTDSITNDIFKSPNQGDSTPDLYGSPPLRRAGLFQPVSYSTTPALGSSNDSARSPHIQDDIRKHTMELSKMAFSSPPRSSYTSPAMRSPSRATPGPDLVFPIADAPPSSSSCTSVSSISEEEEGEELTHSQLTFASAAPSHLSPSFSSSSPSLSSELSSRVPSQHSGSSGPRTILFKPSGLSLLRQEYDHSAGSFSDGARTPTAARQADEPESSVSERTSTMTSTTQRPITFQSPSILSSLPLANNSVPSAGSPRLPSPAPGTPKSNIMRPWQTTSGFESMTLSDSPASLRPPTENTPLLRGSSPRPSVQHGHHGHGFGSSPSPESQRSQRERPDMNQLMRSMPLPRSPSPQLEFGLGAPAPMNYKHHGVCMRLTMWVEKVPDLLSVAMSSMPAVLLGCLLNVLDSVSYGMIIFPATGVFAGLGPMGVSMFFLTTVLSQFVYCLGGSGFAGANGSVMIEVVPFFHILATAIAQQIGDEHPKQIIATTLVAYALSSILTGLSFLLLGALKLGAIVGFFPRHILVGCIGGVGVFLIQTGLAVSIRVSEDELGADWKTIETIFLNAHNLALWLVPLGLAILLRLITAKYHHQLVFPLYFLAIPMLFYVIVVAGRFDLGTLRQHGWLFDMGETGSHQAWYKFYSYFDLNLIKIGPLWSTLPTQFALLFFNILHPPLNVPALAVSLDSDVDTNKELVGHGYSNLLAGLFGTVPNYLVYVNTLLFYRVGGGTRIAGFLLAVMTALLLFVGTAPIAFIPVVVVGALIFVLGLDLVKEALWDTRHRTSRTEYITIISIMVCMTLWDFVIGVLFGIIVSCFFFVVQNSQRRSIRVLHTGETAMSAVRRPSFQRAYLREVSKLTTIIKLQGFLFFGTISYVEDTIRGILEGPSWQTQPIQFLVLDLSLVAGVDMSSAEAFVRIHRFLSVKFVTLVFCGFSAESTVGKALASVQVLDAEGVELFSTFNDAIEWTENVYLRNWLLSQKHESTQTPPGRQVESNGYHVVPSPFRPYLHDLGTRNVANGVQDQPDSASLSEPLNTLIKVFSSYDNIDLDHFRPIENYLERRFLPEGYVLWKQNDQPDGLYIIESGILKASYKFADHTPCIAESMVPGTLAGEMSALSNLPRNATVTVEQDAIVWVLSTENLARLEFEQPKLSRTFLGLILKAAKIDHDILLSALASRQ